MLRLSVLDQSIAVAGRSQGSAIRETVALAQHCEALGYHRFWVSEHHNHPAIVGTAPEIVIAAIAATTERIRIGTPVLVVPYPPALPTVKAIATVQELSGGRLEIGGGGGPMDGLRVSGGRG